MRAAVRLGLIVVVIAFVSLVFRERPSGLSHFDEGQYAFARVWPWIDKFDVDQAFFSPPLFPFLVGLVQRIAPTRPDLAGAVISEAASLLAVLFATLLAKAWWGRAAMLPTFLLTLFSPMRPAFAAVGLTDSLYAALFLATLWSATHAFRNRSTRWVMATAALAGLTWSCKYNGFTVVAVVLGLALHRRDYGSTFRWLFIAAVAALMMAPWFWAIHTAHPDGIAALQRHQQGYLRGWSAAPDNLVTAWNLRTELRSGAGATVACAIWIAAYLGRRHSTSMAALAIILCAEATLGNVLPISGLVLLPLALSAARTTARFALIFAVFATVLLPAIYTPYLRLWLPGEFVLALANAGAIAFIDRRVRFVPSLVNPVRAVAFVSTFLLLGACANVRGYGTGVTAELFATEGYRLIAKKITGSVIQSKCQQVLVYGRPPLLYYLATVDIGVPIQRLPDAPFSIKSVPKPSYLVLDDIALKDSQQLRPALDKESTGLHWRSAIASLPWPPNSVTCLDDFGRLNVNPNAYAVRTFYLDGRGIPAPPEPPK